MLTLCLSYFITTVLHMFIFSQIVMQKLSAGAVSCLSFIPSWKKSLRTLLQHQSLSHVNPMAVATNWSLKCASTCTLTQVSTSYPASFYFRIFGFHVSLKVLIKSKPKIKTQSRTSYLDEPKKNIFFFSSEFLDFIYLWNYWKHTPFVYFY